MMPGERFLESDLIKRLSFCWTYHRGLHPGLAGMPNVPSDEQMLERQDSAKELQSPRGLSSNPRPILADLKGDSPSSPTVYSVMCMSFQCTGLGNTCSALSRALDSVI